MDLSFAGALRNSTRLTGILFAATLLLTGNPASANLIEKLAGEVQAPSGSTSYSLSLDVPSSIHSMAPKLSVSYNQFSGLSNMGSGFSLNATSTITRCSANYKTDGYFSGLEDSSYSPFCLDGARLVAISGLNGASGTEYRLKNDSNVKVVSNASIGSTPQSWTVESPDGYTTTYSRFGNSNNLFAQWFLTSKTDVFGNNITYTYTDGMFPQLEEITYPGFKVDVQYESRADITSEKYQGGNSGQISTRVSSVYFYRDTEYLYHYDFQYEVVGADFQFKIDRVESIQKCYTTSSLENGCTKQVKFQYRELPDPTDVNSVLDRAEDHIVVIPRSFYENSEGQTTLHYRPNYSTADVNNDGLIDFCYFRPNTGVLCAIHDGSSEGGYHSPVAWSSDKFGYEAKDKHYAFYSNLILIDLNSDAYIDYCIADDDGIWCALNSQNDSFEAASRWTTHFTAESTISFQSLNGDNYQDLCGMNSANQYQCLSSDGSRFNSDDVLLSSNLVDFSFEPNWPSNYDPEDSAVEMPSPFWIDIDGDLNSDLCWVGLDGYFKCQKGFFNGTSKALTATAENFFKMAGVRTINNPSEYSFSSGGDIYALSRRVSSQRDDLEDIREHNIPKIMTWRPSDINGDALVDFCYENGNGLLGCHINDGVAFGEWTQVFNYKEKLDYYDKNKSAFRSSMRLEDVSFDGLPDICVVEGSYQTCAYNDGKGSFSDLMPRQFLSMDLDFSRGRVGAYENFTRKIFGAKTSFVFTSMSTSIGKSTTLADMNGDHYPEYCYRSIEGIMCTSMRNFGPQSLLIGVIDSHGNETSIEYGMLISDNLYNPATDIPPGLIEAPENKLVVKAIYTDNGTYTGSSGNYTHNKNKLSYRYGGFIKDPVEQTSGYQYIEVHDEARNFVTKSWLYVEDGLSGTEKRVQSIADGMVVKEVVNDYEYLPDYEYAGVNRVKNHSTTTTQYDLTGQLFSTTVSENLSFDSYLNPTQVLVTKTQGGDVLTTDTYITYDSHLAQSQWIIGKPLTQRVTHTSNHGDQVTREVSYEYNANGSVLKQIIEPNTTDSLTISYEYETNGNLKTETTTGRVGEDNSNEIQSRTVETVRDAIGRVEQSTNALNQISRVEYHSRCGGAEYSYDIEDRKSTSFYDSYCRIHKTEDHLGNSTEHYYSLYDQPVELETKGLNGHGYFNLIAYESKTVGADGSCTIDYFDSLDRKLQTKTCANRNTNTDQRYSVQLSLINGLGQQVAGSSPEFETAGIMRTPRWQRYTYDYMGRVDTTTTMAPDGLDLVIHNEYIRNTHKEFNNRSYGGSAVTKETATGIHGKPTYVIKDGLRIDYSYTAMGDLKTTTTDGRTTELEYDLRGNKSKQIDPSMGTWFYDYNAFGELVYQKDAKGQIVTFKYDKLGRMIKRYENEGVTEWTYDSAENGKGQLWKVQGINENRTLAYNSDGLLTSTLLRTDDLHEGGTLELTTTYDYDELGRIVKTTTPDGVSQITKYDASGNLLAVNIPYSDFTDYEFELIKSERESLVSRLLSMEARRAVFLTKVAQHEAAAARYQAEYLKYDQLNNELDGPSSILMETSGAHRELAARYQGVIDTITKQMQAISNEYGDAANMKYKGVKSGKLRFERKRCKKRRPVFRSCARWQTDTIELDAGDLLLAVQNEEVKYKVETTCKKVYLQGYQNTGYAGAGWNSGIFYDSQGRYRNVCSTSSPLQAMKKAVAEIEALRIEQVELGNAVGESKKQQVENADEQVNAYQGRIDQLNAVVQELNSVKSNLDSVVSSLTPHAYKESTAHLTFSGASNSTYNYRVSIQTGPKVCGNYYCNIPTESKSFSIKKGNWVGHISYRGQVIGNVDFVGHSITASTNQTSFKTLYTSSIRGAIDGKITQINSIIADQTSQRDYYANIADQTVDILMPHTYTKDILVPIGISPMIFVPSKLQVTEHRMTAVSVDTAIAESATRRDYYKGLMESEVEAKNDLIDVDLAELIEDITTDNTSLEAIDSSLSARNIDVEAIDEAIRAKRDLEGQETSELTLWMATRRDANGAILEELYGNGLVTRKEIDQGSGVIKNIVTEPIGQTRAPLRNLSYEYTALGFVTAKTDTVEGISTVEDFGYDMQGRLTNWDYIQNLDFDITNEEGQTQHMTPRNAIARSYEYDESGNLKQKVTDGSGDGEMNFSPVTNRLTDRMADGVRVTYQYDRNGNMTSGDGRSYTWSSFNKAESITGNGNAVYFRYNSDHSRLTKKSGNQVIYYAGPGYERVVEDHGYAKTVTHRHHIIVGDDVVATYEKSEIVTANEVQAQPDQIGYYHRDIIGSGELVTSSDASVIRRKLYTPYGESIKDLLQSRSSEPVYIGTEQGDLVENPDDIDANLNIADEVDYEEQLVLLSQAMSGTSWLTQGLRGFTSHEEIAEFGLINMNARLYDPVIGRFLSADTMVPGIDRPLAFNRYSYVEGNPVTVRDPSGHFPVLLAVAFFMAAQMTDSAQLQMLSTVVLAAAVGGGYHAIFSSGGTISTMGAATSASLTSWTVSFAQSGELTKDSVEAGLWAGVAAGAANWIGHGANGGEGIGSEYSWERYTSHALSQGTISWLRDGDFKSGAIAGLVGHAAGHMGSKQGGDLWKSNPERYKMIMTTWASIGGVVTAAATGGDVHDSIMQSIGTYLYNSFGDAGIPESAYGPKKKVKIGDGVDDSDIRLRTGFGVSARAGAAGIAKLDFVLQAPSIESSFTGNRYVSEEYGFVIDILGVNLGYKLSRSLRVRPYATDAGRILRGRKFKGGWVAGYKGVSSPEFGQFKLGFNAVFFGLDVVMDFADGFKGN